MEAESYPYVEDADAATGIHSPDRQPLVAVFTRLAVLSQDTGRWHKPPGRRDRPGDAPADVSGEGNHR